MTDEQRVQEVLRGAVDDIEVSGDGWADVQARAASAGPPVGGRRPFPSRLVLAAAAAAAAVLVIVSLAVVLTDDDEKGTRVITPAESTTTTPTTPETTVTTTVPSSTMPATFVATRDESSKLVLASSATGETIRTLVDLGATPEGTEESHGTFVIESMALSPDGQYVFYSTGPEPIVGQMHRVSVATGKVDDLPDGSRPTFSPDGDKVAWVVQDSIHFTTVDLQNPVTYTMQVDAILDLEWAPDGGRVVALVLNGEEQRWVQVDATRLREQPKPLDDAGGVLEDSSEAERGTGVLAFLGPDGLSLFSMANGLKLERMMAVDGPTSRVRFDRRGEHALFTGPRGKLYRMTLSDGALVHVADDVALADW